MLDEKWQIANFCRTGNAPEAWRMCAGQLAAAVDVLLEHCPVHKDASDLTDDDLTKITTLLAPLNMLRGFALECLFKALWLSSGKRLAAHGEYRKIPETNDHDLVSLAKANSFSLSDEEKDVLKRLSLYVTCGRYPIHRKWVANKIQRLHGGGKGPPTCWHSPGDSQTYDEVVARVRSRLDGT